jgi:hypothetical protein
MLVHLLAPLIDFENFASLGELMELTRHADWRNSTACSRTAVAGHPDIERAFSHLRRFADIQNADRRPSASGPRSASDSTVAAGLTS